MTQVRPALDAAALTAALRPPWTHIEVVEVTESTNADLLGQPPGSVLVAEYQRDGRGRLSRSWTSPPRAGLTFSAVVPLTVAPSHLGWLPLLAGVALSDAIADVTGVDVRLKWPNDLLAAASGRKLAGILVQLSGDTAVIGIGLNVSTVEAELPVSTATSLALESARSVDRSAILSAVLDRLGAQFQLWADVGGDAEAAGLAAAYRARCDTIGRLVRVVTGSMTTLAGAANVDAANVDAANDAAAANVDAANLDAEVEQVATAVGVDADGRLRISVAGIEQLVAAGDIVHVRTADSQVSRGLPD